MGTFGDRPEGPWNRKLFEQVFGVRQVSNVGLGGASPLLGYCDNSETMGDTINAIEKLAAQAKIAQLAAQLRLRLSYARYKTSNKVTKVPFATLERRLEESTPKQSAYALLLLDGLPVEHNNKPGGSLGISMDDKSIADALRMPPPPSQSLYTTLLQDIEPRSIKQPKSGSHLSSHAGAPSPSGFARFQPSASSQPSPRSSQTQSPGKLLYSSTRKGPSASTGPTSKKTRKKKSSVSLPMADREQLAAKTLASLLAANGSPRSPVKPKPAAPKRSKAQRPHRSSVSSIDASMADAALAISLGGDTDDAASRRGSNAGLGDRRNGKDANGSGMDTAPASPILSAAQRERDSAELLLLFATSPSPARNARGSSQRPPPAIGQGGGRILFSEPSSGSSTSGATGGRGAPSTSNIPSLLLPAAPSPTKKSSSSSLGKSKPQGREERFTVPAHPSLGLSFQPPQSSALQPPFTPETSTLLASVSSFPITQSTPGFALGLSSVAPSTPGGFNMADYINFTPTPGGFSPTQNPKGGKGGFSSGSGSQSTVHGIYGSGYSSFAAPGPSVNPVSPPGPSFLPERKAGDDGVSRNAGSGPGFGESRRVGYITGTDSKRSDEANTKTSRPSTLSEAGLK